MTASSSSTAGANATTLEAAVAGETEGTSVADVALVVCSGSSSSFMNFTTISAMYFTVSELIDELTDEKLLDETLTAVADEKLLDEAFTAFV